MPNAWRPRHSPAFAPGASVCEVHTCPGGQCQGVQVSGPAGDCDGQRSAPMICLQIPSHSIAVLQVFLAIMLLQILFLPQYLTVEQPYACNHINQKNPTGEYQELSQQNRGKCHINGIAGKGKNPVRYQLIRMLCIDANTKALPKRNQTPQ